MKMSVGVFKSILLLERHIEITYGKFGCIFLIAMLGCCQRKCHSYDVRCPQRSEWNLKASSKCGNILEYFCLFDANARNYTEFCKRNPDPSRDITWKKGQRCVFRGNLDGEVCPTDRYQPFKFRTDGNSDCAYKASLCKYEGLLVYKNGSTTTDTQCRCDHTKGFAFVSKTKQRCYCIPSKEDCSCYKKECKGNFKLSSDYNCISIGSWDGQSVCPSLDKRPLTDDSLQMPKLKSTNMDLSADRTFHLRSNLYTVRLIGTVMVFTSIIAMIAIVVFLRRGKEMIDFCSCAKSKVDYTNIITTIDTKTIIDELTLTDSEKETIDSCFGRIKKNKALLKIIVNREPTMKKKFIKVLRRAYYNKQTEIDYHKGYSEHVHNEKIPDDVRRFHDRQIKDWITLDKRIICTHASDEIVKRLKTHNCVLLVGGTGSGKSSILRKSALKLVTDNHTEDFDIVPLVEEPSTLLKEYHNKNRNQIFVIDGIDDSNNDLYIKDIEELIKMVRDRKTKILVSCNTRDFNDNFEALNKHSQTFLCELSNFPLTPKEKKRMMEIYAPEVQVKDIDMEIRKHVVNFEFPLLCKLSKGKNTNDVNRLFSDPLTTIENDLKKLQTDKSHQFCAIALCCLLKKFKVEWLNPNCEQADKKKDVEQICSEFKVDLQDDYQRMFIRDQFDIEKMNWLIKSGDTYQLINEEISNIVTKICQTSHTECFLNNAKTGFVAKWKGPEQAW